MQENISENYVNALEHNPEAFGRVVSFLVFRECPPLQSGGHAKRGRFWQEVEGNYCLVIL
jgi:hypothetical protein